MSVLKIGMPAGSLANVQRGGNLVDLLSISGFKTSGYEKGGPTKFTTTNFLFGWDGRPQEFGSQLDIQELDIAIAGDDWIQERVLELQLEYNKEIVLERVMTLNRGDVRLVGVVNDNNFDNIDDYLTELTKTKELIVVAAELPYLALNWIQKSLAKIGKAKDYANFSVQKYKTPSKIEQGVLVYEAWGKTEAKVKNGGVDIALEITQSGSAIKNYGLKIIDVIMESQTSIWINPIIKKDQAKNELLEMFLLNLYGSIHAENKVIVSFNVPSEIHETIESFLSTNNLYGDEPTVNKGKEFTEYTIQVSTDNKEKPLAWIRYQLAKQGARSINTIPIISCIPGIKYL